MLSHPTLERLSAMGFTGMARAFDELSSNAEAERLTHPEWLALLLDREWSFRLIAGSLLACGLRNCAIRRHRKMLITGAPAAWIAHCS